MQPWYISRNENKKTKINTLQLARKAQDYYERLRANSLVNGWEKYVLTDGQFCIFVDASYKPAPGEAVFYLVTRGRGVTMCQLRFVGDEKKEGDEER